MKKKLISALLASVLALALSVPALAADGDEITAPKGSATGMPSTGEATVTDQDFKVAGDDDETAYPGDTDGADIALWGRIVGGEVDETKIVYKLDVAWGTMCFTFNRSGALWDPTTHTYIPAADGQGDAYWAVSTNKSSLFTSNSRITITNHTNYPIAATLSFAIDQEKFNDDPADPNKVTGYFMFGANAGNDEWGIDHIAQQLTNTADALNGVPKYVSAGPTVSYTLTSAAAHTRMGTHYEAQAWDVLYNFVLCGTPDPGKVIENYTKIGVITVTFAKDDAEYELYTP